MNLDGRNSHFNQSTHGHLPMTSDDDCHGDELCSQVNSSKSFNNQFPNWPDKRGNNSVCSKDNSEVSKFSKCSEGEDNNFIISKGSSAKSQSPKWSDSEAANKDSSKRSDLEINAANGVSNRSNCLCQSPKWSDREATHRASSKSSNWGHRSQKQSESKATDRDSPKNSNWGHQSPKWLGMYAADNDSSERLNCGRQSLEWSGIEVAEKDRSDWPYQVLVSGNRTAAQEKCFNKNTSGCGKAPDQTRSDARRKCSPSMLPRGGWDRSHRSRSRSPFYGSKRGLERRDTSDRMGKGRSRDVPYRDSAAVRYGIGNESKHHHMGGLRRHSDKSPDNIKECKRRYSGHNSDDCVTYTLDRRCSRERLTERHERDFRGEQKHKLHGNYRRSANCDEFSNSGCCRGSLCNHIHDGGSNDGRSFMKDDSKERAYDRRDLHTSIGQRREIHGVSNIPCKCFAKGRCHCGEDCSFSHRGMTHGHRESHSTDHKRGRNMNIDKSLPWDGPKWGDQATTRNSPRSSRWRSSDDKQKNNLSQNDPKRDDERTAGNAPSLSWNGPKWGDETNAKGAPSLSWNGPKWGDETTDKDTLDVSWNGPKLGEEETTEDVPSSGPKWSDDTIAKSASHFSWNAPKRHEEETVKDAPDSSWKGPTWGDQVTTENAPSSSWKGLKSGDGETSKDAWNLSCNGPKLGDEKTTKDADDIRECKRRRYSGHNSEKCSPHTSDRRCYSQDRLPERHGHDFSDEQKHELHRNYRRSSNSYEFSDGRCCRGSMCNYIHDDASDDGGSFMEEDFKERTHDRQDLHASFGQRREIHRVSNIPCKYMAKGHCRRGEDCNFSHQRMTHGHRESHSNDHKCGHNMNIDKSLPWDGPKWGDQATTSNAPRSSRWRSDDDKRKHNLSQNDPKRDDERTARNAPSLSWNGPKWGDETNAKDAPSLSWNGPKWGDEAAEKDAPSLSWNGPKRGEEATVKDGSCTGPKWSDETIAKDAPHLSQNAPKWRDEETTTDAPSSLWNGPKWGDPVTTKVTTCSSWKGPMWGDGATSEGDLSLSCKDPKWCDEITTKDAPGSPQWKSDEDKWVCKREPDNVLSWNGPKSGGQTTIKDLPYSSRLKLDDGQGCDEETIKTSLNGPHWSDREPTRQTPISSQWKSDEDKGNYNLKPEIFFPLKGPDVDSQTTAKDSSNSSHLASDNRQDTVKTDDSLLWNASKQGDQMIAKDAPYPSHHRSDVDEGDYIMVIDDNSLLNGPKWGDQVTKKDESYSISSKGHDASPQPLSNPRALRSHCQSHQVFPKLGHNMDINKSSPWDGPKLGGGATTRNARRSSTQATSRKSSRSSTRATTREAPKSARWSDDDKQGYHTEADKSLSQHDAKWDDERTARNAPSLSWNGPKWGDETNAKDAASLSWNGPKWGDEATDKDAPGLSWNGPKWGEEATVKDASCSGPKWSDKTITKDAPHLSQNAPKRRDEETTTDAPISSWNGPKWGDPMTTKVTTSSSCKGPKWGDGTSEGALSLSRKGPKWCDEITTKDAPGSSQWKSDEDMREPNNYLSRNGPKWGGQTTIEDLPCPSRLKSDDEHDDNLETDKTSWNGPKWGDHGPTRHTPSSSQWKSDDSKGDYNLKIGKSLLWNGPGRGGHIAAKDSPNSSQLRSDYRQDNVITDINLPWNGSKQGDKMTSKDTPHPSHQRSNVDKSGCNVVADNSSSWNGPKWGDQTTKNDASHSSQWRSNVDERECSMEVGNCLSLNGPKWGDQMSFKDAPSSCWRSSDADSTPSATCLKIIEIDDNSSKPLDSLTKNHKQDLTQEAIQGALPTKDQNITLGASGKDQYNLIISQPLLTQKLHHNGEDQHSVILCEKSLQLLIDSLQEGQKKHLDYLISPERNDASTLPPSNLQSLGSHWQSHQVFGISKQPSATVNDLVTEPFADAAALSIPSVQPMLQSQSTDPVISDSGDIFPGFSSTSIQPEGPPMVAEETQATSKSLGPSFNGGRNNGKQTKSSSSEDKLHCRNQDAKQVFGISKQLSATVTPLVTEPLADAAASSVPSVQPTLQSQSTDPAISDSSDIPPGFSSISIQPAGPTVAEETQATPKSLGPSLNDGRNNGKQIKSSSSEEKLHCGNQEAKQVDPNACTAEEVNTAQSKEEQCTARKGVDDVRIHANSKRSMDDEKDIRRFKFVLAEFVKDVLKPSWQDGRLSKDSHKTIVKKVVDKVSDTLQGPDIPRTSENIDHYMSFSKLKLTNLIKAYLERYT